MLGLSATQTISHLYALLLWGLNKCYYSETYADYYNIRCNSSKSQLIHFTDNKKVKRDISIEMKNGSRIEMVDKCQYIGTLCILI